MTNSRSDIPEVLELINNKCLSKNEVDRLRESQLRNLISWMKNYNKNGDLVRKINENKVSIEALISQPAPDMPGSRLLGSGTYNIAIEMDGRVYKFSQSTEEQTDTPERSVRLWNEINGADQARLENSGWSCPFAEGAQASDEEIADSLINIFNRTGRIVVDAISPENFIKTRGNEITCIDVGLALQLTRNEEDALSKRHAKRRKSIVSTEAWDNFSYQNAFDRYFKSRKLSPAVQIITSLLFISTYRADIVNADFLRDKEISSALSNAYKAHRELQLSLVNPEHFSSNQLYRSEMEILKSIELIESGKALLEEQCPRNLDQLRSGCISRLTHFINSSTAMNAEMKAMNDAYYRNNRKEIHRVSQFIKDTSARINITKDAINKIKNARSPDEINKILEETMGKYTNQFISPGGLLYSIEKCYQATNEYIAAQPIPTHNESEEKYPMQFISEAPVDTIESIKEPLPLKSPEHINNATSIEPDNTLDDNQKNILESRIEAIRIQAVSLSNREHRRESTELLFIYSDITALKNQLFSKHITPALFTEKTGKILERGIQSERLNNHRGAKKVLVNLLFSLSILGFVYLAATQKQRRGFWYHPDTHSIKVLKDAKANIPKAKK